MSGERVERRLAAILAADVAGYSRLMGQDEAGTLSRLRAHRRELIDPRIAEHKGRIVKTTGDGILIEFPSVVGAVTCAVAVQEGMAERNAAIAVEQRIEFRVGINLGDVIVEDGDIHGDGVNVAARLEALAEPGSICLSAVVHDQVRDKLDLAFDDLGDQALKNIARPMRVYRVRTGTQVPASLGLRTAVMQSSALALPDKPSVAVLPFANMTSDPEQEFLADGIAEDVITALSRYPSLFVIARNSSFTYRGRTVDVKQVGAELGVRYVLEGSLRKSGNRVRVSAQLVEAETGKHVWAERYDRDLADIFAVQDEIAEAVTIAIAPAIAEAERQRAMRKSPGSLDAWAAYQRGLWHLSKTSAEDNALAETFFQRTIDLDANFGGGYCGLAAVLHQGARLFRTRELREAQDSAERLARQAVALDAGDAESRARLALLLMQRGDHEGARAEAQRALAISPNFARAHGVLGATLIFAGWPEEGLASIANSIRLDPRDAELMTIRWIWISQAHYFTRDYAAALDAAEQAVRTSPDYPTSYRWVAAALGQLGRTEEAKDALAKAIAAPAFDLHVRRRMPWIQPHDHAHVLEGLRKAGWEG